MRLVRITLIALLLTFASALTPSSATASPRQSMPDVDPVLLSDTINHWEVKDRLRFFAAVARNEQRERRQAEAKAAAARASRSRPAAPRISGGGDIYDALARCETGMRNISSANGWYHSYFQWARYTTVRNGKTIHVDTWKSLGGEGRAEDNSYETQKQMVINKIPLSAWDTQFPGCARKLGVG